MESFAPALLDHGAAVVFAVILAARLGLPLPATAMLALAGALAVQGRGSGVAIVAASAAANLLGDGVWFAAGRKWGLSVMRLLCKVSLSPSSCVGRSEDLMLRWGGVSLVAGKFLPGVSAVAPPMAGALGMKATTFAAFSAVSGVVWSASILAVGFALRGRVAQVLAALTHFSLVGIAIAAAVLALVYLRQRCASRFAAVARITPAELLDGLRHRQAPVVIDVRSRSAAALDARRIDGSVHVPLRELRSRIREFEAFERLVVYCNCPQDASAASAAQILLADRGRDVRVLSGGLDGWFASASRHPAPVVEAAL